MTKQSPRLLLAAILCLAAPPLASQSVAAGPVRTVPATTVASIAVPDERASASDVAMRIDDPAAPVA